MSEIIVPPFYITYDGNDADQHILNAQKLGESIIGASKLYSAVAHYCMYGTVPRGNYQKKLQCYAKPPAEGCYEYMLLIASVATEGALLNNVFKEGLNFLLPRILGVLKKVWSRPTETEKVVDRLAQVIELQARENSSVQMAMINTLGKANDNQSALFGKLMETIPQLADNTRGHAKDFASPVGSSCKSVTQFAHTNKEILISEEEAEVIRGGADMEVDEMQQFKCKRITEVNVENGHCILDIEELSGLVTGKISDPALEKPNNIYTRSLNSQTPFYISAKPVKRNGVVKKLYVSDAKEAA